MKTNHPGWRHGAGIPAKHSQRRMARLPIHLLNILFAPFAWLVGASPRGNAAMAAGQKAGAPEEILNFRTPDPRRGFGGHPARGRHGGKGGGHNPHGFGDRPAWKSLCVHNCPECALPDCVHPGGPKHGRSRGIPSRRPAAQPWMAATEPPPTAPDPAQKQAEQQPTQQEESCPGDCRSCPNGVCVKTGRLRAVRPRQ